MSELHDIKLGSGNCLGCGADITGHLQTKPGTVPKEGDVSVCAECTIVMIYKEDLTFRFPTPGELVAVEKGLQEKFGKGWRKRLAERRRYHQGVENG